MKRRTFLASAASFAASACGGHNLKSPFSIGTGHPRIKLPHGACDSHIHILDPRFPAIPGWRGEPVNDATVLAYRQFQKRIGTQRVVVVTPSTYGDDNRATLDALHQFGNSSRGVVVLDCDAPLPDLAEMNRAGVRGIRVNFVSPQSWGQTDARRLRDTAKIAAAQNWHIQIYAKSHQIADLEPVITQLGIPVVIDHLGNVSPPDTQDSGHLAALRLLQNGRTWLKLSGPYISSRTGGPAYTDLVPVARRYVAAAPERLVWGSDWPHRGQAASPPDDAVLIDQLLVWAPNEDDRRRILVDNPTQLYGF